jgi:hypothetical protein
MLGRYDNVGNLVLDPKQQVHASGFPRRHQMTSYGVLDARLQR